MQNPRVLLILIAVLFTAPLLLAVLMRSSWWDFRPSELSNRGTLVQPPVALDTSLLEQVQSDGLAKNEDKKHWRVLILDDGSCMAACKAVLAGVRQVHLASGKHQEDIALWVLTPQLPEPPVVKLIREIYPAFDLYYDVSNILSSALSGIAMQEPLQDDINWRGQAFVLDPATHIILRYEPGFDPNDLAGDLDRLLTWSKQN